MANDYFTSTALTRDTLARAGAVNDLFTAVSEGFDLLPPPTNFSQHRFSYAADSGAANAYVVTLAPAPSAYVVGLTVDMLAANANTGASTINVNALGTKQILTADGAAVGAGVIPSTRVVTLKYDGTAFRLTSTSSEVTPVDESVTAAKISTGDVAAIRTKLALVVGTNVQAYDAELAALAGLTSAADKVPYFTGSGTAGLADFTAAGRALVDDASATAQRTTLGLGSIATQSAASVTITGGAITGITDLAVADGGTGASTASAALANLGGVGPDPGYGSIGSIITARTDTTVLVAGDQIAGSALNPMSWDDAGGYVADAAPLSGTWRNMGGSKTATYRIGVFQRIA